MAKKGKKIGSASLGEKMMGGFIGTGEKMGQGAYGKVHFGKRRKK
jgi:hypothetical protein